eukprot:TRINITY_DN19864_c2_g1_i1.p1 TRINITY_DN19864_c2_g1~~TRINITY_DN19864_c2_g1_i1.p1  ORF type:complete len:606 (+),score=136.96 TRINITY_DN19864_c2_g1_i1:83-1819(+)
MGTSSSSPRRRGEGGSRMCCTGGDPDPEYSSSYTSDYSSYESDDGDYTPKKLMPGEAPYPTAARGAPPVRRKERGVWSGRAAEAVGMPSGGNSQYTPAGHESSSRSLSADRWQEQLPRRTALPPRRELNAPPPALTVRPLEDDLGAIAAAEEMLRPRLAGSARAHQHGFAHEEVWTGSEEDFGDGQQDFAYRADGGTHSYAYGSGAWQQRQPLEHREQASHRPPDRRPCSSGSDYVPRAQSPSYVTPLDMSRAPAGSRRDRYQEHHDADRGRPLRPQPPAAGARGWQQQQQQFRRYEDPLRSPGPATAPSTPETPDGEALNARLLALGSRMADFADRHCANKSARRGVDSAPGVASPGRSSAVTGAVQSMATVTHFGSGMEDSGTTTSEEGPVVQVHRLPPLLGVEQRYASTGYSPSLRLSGPRSQDDMPPPPPPQRAPAEQGQLYGQCAASRSGSLYLSEGGEYAGLPAPAHTAASSKERTPDRRFAHSAPSDFYAGSSSGGEEHPARGATQPKPTPPRLSGQRGLRNPPRDVGSDALRERVRRARERREQLLTEEESYSQRSRQLRADLARLRGGE